MAHPNLLFFTAVVLSSPVKSITATHNSYLLFLGPIQLNKLINGKSNGTAGSIIDIHHILEINGQIDIYAGDVNLIGGYLNMLAGNFLVAEEGNFQHIEWRKTRIICR